MLANSHKLNLGPNCIRNCPSGGLSLPATVAYNDINPLLTVVVSSRDENNHRHDT